MELSIKSKEFLDGFDHIDSNVLDGYGKNKLDLFVLKINANEFDYNSLSDRLTDPVIEYSLSRKVRERYSDRPGTLSKKAREKFLDYLKNKGELGELLLYCFLETHLNAPKILSKLELKTSTGHYVNGADGVHFLKLDDGNYQLIFGESKTIKSLTTALTDAFKSIYEFKNCVNAKGDEKSGLPFEKSLVSDNLEKEEFSEDEINFIRSVIVPKRDNDFEVDDAFGVFVGYEVAISAEDKRLPNQEFRLKVQEQVKSEVKKSFEHIKSKIEEHELTGHHFYVYVLPFTNLEDSRKKIQKEITK